MFSSDFIGGFSKSELMVYGHGGFISIFSLFGYLFLVVGLLVLCSPFWAFRNALKTVYVVTDRRAITFESGFERVIRSYDQKDLKVLQRREFANGTGDLVFARQEWHGSKGNQYLLERGFINIQNPKKIENLLRQIASSQNKPTIISELAN